LWHFLFSFQGSVESSDSVHNPDVANYQAGQLPDETPL
jgi:hypothetical protein